MLYDFFIMIWTCVFVAVESQTLNNEQRSKLCIADGEDYIRYQKIYFAQLADNQAKILKYICGHERI